jgi:hypothetical protein
MFAFVYLAINYLTKNMTVVLLTAVFATNFFIVGKKVKESFEGGAVKEGMTKTETDAVASELVEEVEEVVKVVKDAEKEEYSNIAHKLKPTDVAPVEFNSDSAELTKQLKILNERTQNSMGMINKLGGIGNIGKMVDNLTSIVGKLG